MLGRACSIPSNIYIFESTHHLCDLISSRDALEFSEHRNNTYDVVHLTMADESNIAFDPMSIASSIVPVFKDHLGKLFDPYKASQRKRMRKLSVVVL